MVARLVEVISAARFDDYLSANIFEPLAMVDTDFLVIGAAPFAPAFTAGAVISPQVADQIKTRELERSRFQALIKQAQSLWIPVVTQNQFLYLAGYTGS